MVQTVCERPRCARPGFVCEHTAVGETKISAVTDYIFSGKKTRNIMNKLHSMLNIITTVDKIKRDKKNKEFCPGWCSSVY